MAPASTRTRSSRVYRAKPRFAEEAKSLGEELRKLRLERGWSLYDASEATTVDLKHIQKLESGRLNPTLVTLLRLADGFDEPLARLFASSRQASIGTKPARAKVAISSSLPRFTKRPRTS